MKELYSIYKEFNRRTGQERKNLRKGTTIRIDALSCNLHKIKLLHRCKNWKVESKYQNGDHMTYYINIL